MSTANYDEIARGVNAPIFEYYARKIKENTACLKGVCVDVGSGGGYLGLALARITDLDFVFLDISENALERAKAHIVEDGLQNRAKTLCADVHHIPLPDGSVNLVISRGSIPFWKDKNKALREIYRVLVPGGAACVVAGRGTPEMQARLKEEMTRRGMKWPEIPDHADSRGEEGSARRLQRNYDAVLRETGIPAYRATRADDGLWIQLWKLQNN